MARNRPPRQETEDGLPSRQQILDFIASSNETVGKRDIAKAFGIKGGQRIALKRLLKEMAVDGKIAGNRREFRPRGALAGVSVIEITGRDRDGDLIGRPVTWEGEDGERPIVRIIPDGTKDIGGEIGIGDQVMARVSPREPDGGDKPNGHAGGGASYDGIAIKKLARDKRRLLGIFRAGARGGGGTIEPIDRKAMRSWPVDKLDDGGVKDGDLVRFDLVKRGRFGAPRARILESLGNPDDQRQISLIAVHSHGIPDDFPESVIEEANGLHAATLDRRTDLRQIPLITIDPQDARDHDDAVFAEHDSDTRNAGGWIVLVAIADVAHYVRSGGILDREAEMRGNSVYFPDRVVPMLPERISNDLCSLREGQDRACLAVRMIFDKFGDKRSHTFMRGLMRSAAKLSYQEAQAAIDGAPTEKCVPLMAGVLEPLWDAYKVLSEARDKRGPLNLDLPERRILLDDKGRVDRVITPERLTAHRLIEEFMIQANVAAAEELESKKTPVMYRIHDQPGAEKLKNLREFLETLNLGLGHGTLKPVHFNRTLEEAKKLPSPDLVNEVVLRAQAQAEYNPANIGHFGLNLRRYAHFTSPIRRYADLLVHRALVRALDFGDDGLDDKQGARFSAIGKAISDTERRAMAAERETTDRLIAAHLSDKVGATFNGRIAGVTRSGLFVKLADTGADGFVPVSTLGDDYYRHVEESHALVGNRTNLAYRLGDKVEVRLVECVPSAGALRFEMLSPGVKGGLSSAPRAAGTRFVPRRPSPPRGRGRR